MDNSAKFSLLIDKLNKIISDLNIKLSKDSNNESLKNELNCIIADRDLLFKCDLEDFERLIIKYGELINE